MFTSDLRSMFSIGKGKYYLGTEVRVIAMKLLYSKREMKLLASVN